MDHRLLKRGKRIKESISILYRYYSHLSFYGDKLELQDISHLISFQLTAMFKRETKVVIFYRRESTVSVLYSQNHNADNLYIIVSSRRKSQLRIQSQARAVYYWCRGDLIASNRDKVVVFSDKRVQPIISFSLV